MKKYFYLLGIVSLTASCGTATYMYDDVYDAAEGKSLTEEGYTDLIKDNEKNHKVVVDKEDKVTFGGYYPSTNQSGGTSFSNRTNNDNCNCDCWHNSNQWRYHQPGWIYNHPNSVWFNNCSCNHWNNALAYHYLSFGNSYNLYGYYDYWGGWHAYYPLGMDPYGYYAYQYGWYPYQWYNNNNNGIFNGNNVVNTPSNTNTNGNYFYGHRNPSSTGSSNTTVYAHTVKDVIVDQTSVGAENDVQAIFTPFTATTGSKQAGANTLNTAATVSFGSGVQADVATNENSFKPVSINTNPVSNTTKPFVSSNQESTGTVTVNTGNATHVVASNPFEVKYPVGTASRTVPGQSNNTGYTTDPSSSNSGNTTYYPAPVTTGGTTTTNSSTTTTTTTTSRRTSTETYNYNSNTNSGSNTTNSHRSTPTTTSGGSGSSTNSGGGSRSTTTSRR